MTGQSFTIGIDVAKLYLDIHIHPAGRSLRCANTKAGRKAMLTFIAKHNLAGRSLAVLEASGGYERPVWQCLQQVGYDVHLVQPLRAKHFIRALGEQAKTDKIDARALALFGASGMTKGSMLPNEEQLAFRDLARALEALRKQVGQYKEQVEKTTHPKSKKAFKSLHRACAREAEKLEAALEEMVAENPLLSHLVDLLVTMPGIGRYTAMILVAELPELGHCSKAQVAAIAGLAPYTRQSGAWIGQSHILGGRKHVRKALYMAALSAIKHNPDMKKFYEKLRKAGKKFKVAITAIMRRMIVALNSMVKNETVWKIQKA